VVSMEAGAALPSSFVIDSAFWIQKRNRVNQLDLQYNILNTVNTLHP
jgi:hypothetical protein